MRTSWCRLDEKHDPTAQFVSKIRKRMHRDFPGITASFPPADIVAQILNFGLPAPIDVQIVGRQYRRQCAIGQSSGRSNQPYSRRGRCARSTTFRFAADEFGGRSHPSFSTWDHREPGRQFADWSLERVFTGQPEFLARSEKWRQLHGEHSGASIFDRFVGRVASLPILGPAGTTSATANLGGGSAHSNPRQPGANHSFFRTSDRHALQYPAGRRYLWRSRGQRSRICSLLKFRR